MNSSLESWTAARRATVDRAVARVVGIDRSRGVRFSGIAWDSHTVVTAAELLHGADAVMVDTGDGIVPAQMLACDLSVDVAVLKAATGAPGISSAEFTPPALGDDVVIAGRGHSGPAVAWSHVEQVGPAWRSRLGGELDRLLLLSPRLDPMLEGGGTFDLEGRLCAMAVRGPRHRTIGIPSETIDRIVSTVLEHGYLPQPYLGVRLQPVRLDEALQQRLARGGSDATIIVGMEPDSPAARSDLLFGDLLVAVGDQAIQTPVDLKIALSRIPLGSSAGIRVFRAGALLECSVVIGERSRP